MHVLAHRRAGSEQLVPAAANCIAITHPRASSLTPRNETPTYMRISPVLTSLEHRAWPGTGIRRSCGETAWDRGSGNAGGGDQRAGSDQRVGMIVVRLLRAVTTLLVHVVCSRCSRVRAAEEVGEAMLLQGAARVWCSLVLSAEEFAAVRGVAAGLLARVDQVRACERVREAEREG